MSRKLLITIQAANRAVKRLLYECRKNGPVYDKSPKAAAQVSRTGKWLLQAAASLQKALAESPGPNPAT